MKFPNRHFIISGTLALGLALISLVTFNSDGEGERFTTESVDLGLLTDSVTSGRPAPSNLPWSIADVSTDDQILEPQPQPTQLGESIAPTEPEHVFKQAKVKSGDSLAAIFKRQGISARELALLLESKPLGARLKKIFPGQQLQFWLTPENDLVRLVYSPGPLESLEFERQGEQFVGLEIRREPERLSAYKHAVIDQSLFLASQRAGLDDATTMRIAQIFQWDIDFVLDIRKGDEFYVLLEELYLGDEFIGYGEILAAEFINQKQSYQAALYTDTQGQPGFFGRDGRNMRKAFLRTPVEFSRISSNFNLRRKHPLHNRTMPHRGIDYAAPNGTPILAAGDGRVTVAGRSDSNGNYVVLQHGEQFMTKYLHLSKFARGVRSGNRVRQGQVIGYVGATGWATGPHLHYEFLVNGVHMNPRTVNLPNAAPVPRGEIERFEQQVTPLLTLLENYRQQIQLALVQ